MIKKNITEENAFVEIYTTLEPCIMCLGTLVMSRVNRIVFACPDPLGGATSINKNTLSTYYVEI